MPCLPIFKPMIFILEDLATPALGEILFEVHLHPVCTASLPSGNGPVGSHLTQYLDSWDILGKRQVYHSFGDNYSLFCFFSGKHLYLILM